MYILRCEECGTKKAIPPYWDLSMSPEQFDIAEDSWTYADSLCFKCRKLTDAPEDPHMQKT